jgi:hypothetical protein
MLKAVFDRFQLHLNRPGRRWAGLKSDYRYYIANKRNRKLVVDYVGKEVREIPDRAIQFLVNFSVPFKRRGRNLVSLIFFISSDAFLFRRLVVSCGSAAPPSTSVNSNHSRVRSWKRARLACR